MHNKAWHAFTLKRNPNWYAMLLNAQIWRILADALKLSHALVVDTTPSHNTYELEEKLYSSD